MEIVLRQKITQAPNVSSTEVPRERSQTGFIHMLKRYTGLLPIYLTTLALGCAVAFLVKRLGIDAISAWLADTAIFQLYQVIGHAFWGLAPLSIWLMYLFFRDCLVCMGSDKNPTAPKLYEMIRENAPLIGVAGTIEGISIGINSMDVSAGIEVAYNSLKGAVGNASYSTLWGILLVLFINVVVAFVNKDWEDYLTKQKQERSAEERRRQYEKQSLELLNQLAKGMENQASADHKFVEQLKRLNKKSVF